MIEFSFGAEGVGEAKDTGKFMGDTMEITTDCGGGSTWSAKGCGQAPRLS